jgi:hypothetical protein
MIYFPSNLRYYFAFFYVAPVLLTESEFRVDEARIWFDERVGRVPEVRRWGRRGEKNHPEDFGNPQGG